MSSDLSSDPPHASLRWLNLPLPRDIRKLIGTYLTPLDRMMVRHAHGAKFTCEYAHGCDWMSVRSRYNCSVRCNISNGTCNHDLTCIRKHASVGSYCCKLRECVDAIGIDSASAETCDWEWFKILCARYDAADLFAHMAAGYPALTVSHPYSHAIYATAVYYDHIGFLEALARPPFNGIYTVDGGFCWQGIPALEYVSSRTSEGTYKYLRSRGAVITIDVYDRALAAENMPLVNAIVSDYCACACGKPSRNNFTTIGYYHCGSEKCTLARNCCIRGGNVRTSPWDIETYKAIFRAGNIAAADWLWPVLQPAASAMSDIIIDCNFAPQYYSPASITAITDWLLSHYPPRYLRCMYMYAAGVEVSYDDDGELEYARTSVPNITLLNYLIEKKIPVDDHVLHHVAPTNIEVYHAIRGSITVNTQFVVAAITNRAMDVFRASMQDFNIPVDKRILTALWNADEYATFAELLQDFEPMKTISKKL